MMSVVFDRFAPCRLVLVAALVLAGLVPAPAPSLAQDQVGASTGLPIPRFVSIRNAPTNVRVGPGTQYQIAYTFLKPGLPIEIIAEFDTWRRIRDVEGDDGWVHQNLVVATRTAFIAPWQSDDPIALRTAARADAPVRAWLSPNLLVTMRRCDGAWCEVRFSHADESGATRNWQGFVAQESLWGVYAGEEFN